MASMSLEAKCSCCLNILSFILIFLALLFTIFNHCNLADLYDQIYENDGIPGSAEDRVKIRHHVDKIFAGLADYEKRNGLSERNGRAQRLAEEEFPGKNLDAGNNEFEMNNLAALLGNSMAGNSRQKDDDEGVDDINDDEAFSAHPITESYDELADDITKLLEQNMGPDIDQLALHVVSSLQNIGQRLNRTDSDLKSVIAFFDAFSYDRWRTSAFQLSNLVTETFGFTQSQYFYGRVRLAWGPNSYYKADACSSAIKGYPDWTLYIGDHKNADEAYDLCYQNGGEWLGSSRLAEWGSFQLLLRTVWRLQPSWGVMFNDSVYRDHMKERMKCFQNNYCSEILNGLKVDTAFENITSLNQKFSVVYAEYSGNYIWFQDRKKGLPSFCSIAKLMMRWGYDLEGAQRFASHFEMFDAGGRIWDLRKSFEF